MSSLLPGTPGGIGGRGDLVRRHNLGLVLRSVHLAPKTRSALTRISGLNRSTIGALVSDLVERRLVVEEVASPLGTVGRPSPVVRPSDDPVAIAVNPEVDAVTVALVRLGGRVLAKERVPFERTPSPDDAARAAAAAARRLVADAGPRAIVVGAGAAVPGIVRRSDGHVRLAPNLDWRDAPFAEALRSALDMDAWAANDAALGAQAEWFFGAGRGVDDLVYVHGGVSGIGGGVVSGGVLLSGANGHAGEIGHVAVRRHGHPDKLALRGTLESEVRRSRLLDVLGLDRAGPDDFEAALLASDDPAVQTEVRRQIDHLAFGVAAAVGMLNPDRIVLGGFLSALVAKDRARLERAVTDRALPLGGETVDIRRAELGSDLLDIGAAELPFSRLFADPLAA